MLLSTGDLFRALTNTPEMSDEKIKSFCPRIFPFFEKFGQDKAVFSITEYIFLTSLIINPRTQFKIAFDMIDFDRTGKLQREEFDKMKCMFRKQISIADHKLKSHNTFIDMLFFDGDSTDKQVGFPEFYKFAANFEDMLIELEYAILDTKSPNTEGVSRKDFADLILDSTNLTSEVKEKRVQLIPRAEDPVTLDDYRSFFILMANVDEFKTVIKFMDSAGQAINMKAMQKATKISTLNQPDPTDNVLEILFKLFDVNGDDSLDYAEFVGCLKHQAKFKYVLIG